MDEKIINKSAVEISNIIDAAVKNKNDEKAFQIVCNICIRLATYPLIFMDSEGRQDFMPKYVETVNQALQDFHKHMNQSEAN